MIRFLLIRWVKFRSEKAMKEFLKPEFKNDIIKEIIKNYWNSYKVNIKNVKRQKSIGGDCMYHLAVLSYSFYIELESRNIDFEKRVELYNNIAWEIYSKSANGLWKILSIFYKNKYKRLKKAVLLSQKFPFSPPAFKWKEIKTDNNEIGFDCLNCEVANYFKSKNAGIFCARTWCSFDFKLAEIWGVELDRKETIAQGSKICNFRWIVN